MRFSEAAHTAQYWPKRGSQQSAIVIGPMSAFASIKCFVYDGSFCQLFKFSDLQPKLGPVSALYVTGPCVIFTTANHFGMGKPEFGTSSKENKC